MRVFRPNYFEDNIFNINISALKRSGIRLILTDIDNTLVPYAVPEPGKAVMAWFKLLTDEGFKVCFLSNNSFRRVDIFNRSLGYYAVHKAKKPLPFAYLSCAKKFGCKRTETCFIGDQLFTDILGANLAGVTSVLVKPIKTDDEDLQIRIKRSLEKAVLKHIAPKRLGVIGNPIEHSLSPMLHRFFYERCNINAEYKRYKPEKGELGKYIEYFRNNGFTGFNVTVPYKSEIIKYLDFTDDNAKKINSVNTVKIINGKLYGYSTDGEGFCSALIDGGRGARVKLIGAGGTAPAIIAALLKNGATSVTVYNRTLDKAQKLAEDFENVTALPLEAFCPKDCDILINTTSAELLTGKPAVASLAGISPQTAVYDTNYKPKTTRFMQLAADEGCKAYNGLEMLVRQGLLSHKIWFEGE